MHLNQLNIVNYRNVEAAEVPLSTGINCFVGRNGAGKTNLLDAVYYLSFCKSMTGLPDSQNVRHEQPFFVIQGHYDLDGDPNEIYCGFKPGSKKQFKRNKKEYHRLAEHIGLLPLVIISPRDETLIAEGGEARRKYADSVISQCDSGYLDHLMAYGKLLSQRNALLKQMGETGVGTNTSLLDILDEQLCEHAMPIAQSRRHFVEWLRPVINQYYADIAGGAEQVDIAYNTCFDRYDLLQGLHDTHTRDLALGYTSRGIHKDDIEFSMGGYSMKRVGSQGQRKSFVIALKLAQYQYLTEQKKMRPILLLDDVFDKLDALRGDSLIELTASESFDQIFITDTDLQRLKRVLNRSAKDHKIFGVENGQVNLQ